MKIKLPGLIFFFLITGFAQAQSQLVTDTLGRLSAKFPSKPVSIPEDILVTKGSDSVSYVLSFTSLLQPGIDSATIESRTIMPEFYDDLKEMLEDGLKLKLEKFELGMFNGFRSYKTHSDSNNKEQVFIYAILIVDKMYTLMSIVPKGSSTKGKDLFFSSAMLVK